MTEQSEHEKAAGSLEETGRCQTTEQDGAYKTNGRKSLMVDKDGFVKEVGEGFWHRYDPRDDQ